MVPAPAGVMVAECWHALSEQFPNIEFYLFTLMPNHLHGTIIVLETSLNVNHNPVVLGNMIGAFKSISTNEYIEGVQEKGWEPYHKRLWQRDFYDRIIRNDQELETVRAYIVNNPAKWKEDKLHPAAPPNEFNKWWETAA